MLSKAKKLIIQENKKIKKYHQSLFLILLYLSYILYFSVFLSYMFPKTMKRWINIDSKTYLNNITFFINGYVSIVLLIKFNPWNSSSFTKFDRQLVFSASTVVFITTFFTTLS
jgi:hypothetical protein